MALVGYARCSTTHQELEHQLEGLKAALVDQLFSEHISGAAPFSERVELQRAIDACQPGDELLIPKLDRLGRTMIMSAGWPSCSSVMCTRSLTGASMSRAWNHGQAGGWGLGGGGERA